MGERSLFRLLLLLSKLKKRKSSLNHFFNSSPLIKILISLYISAICGKMYNTITDKKACSFDLYIYMYIYMTCCCAPCCHINFYYFHTVGCTVGGYFKTA